MYKLKIALIVFTFFAIADTQAQANFKPGLRAGLSLSTISEMHANYRPDFYVGGFGEINISKRYALQPEINYTRQGSNNVRRNYYDPNTETEKIEYRDLQMDYLSFSLINKFTIKEVFQIEVGPSLDVLVNDNLAVRKSYNDVALVTGVAYRTTSGLVIEIRFKKGLYDILESSYYQNNSSENSIFGNYNTNMNLQIGISYSFNGK